ncbi:MAG TPA: protein kinase [Candidatus Acidoferrum sp.]
MKKLGKFEIIEKVGQGAMGVVYKARDPFIDRIVALKTLTTGLAEDPNLLKRFYSEARSAGGLQHPNIVTIYELGHEGSTPFIAMQFLNGESLDKIIDRQPNLPLSQKVGFIVYVCRALEYAHKQNPPVVHRDIKPGNVMVTPEGTVMVVDFGIARLGEGTRSQSAGMLIGTLGYMSPQLFRNSAADARSDIWAAGVMFYELLAYRRPFEGDNAAALMSNIILERPRSLDEAAPGTPADVQAVVDRMLAKEIESRYQTMEEVLLELEPIWQRLRQLDVSKLLANSQQLFDAGDLESAKAKVIQIIQIDTSNTHARTLLEKINMEVRRKQIVPQLKARVEKAERLLANGQIEDAKAEVEAALQLDSTFLPARELRGQVEEALERSRKIAQALRASKQSMAEGALTEAQLQFDKVLELDPGNVAAREQLRLIKEERSRRERRKVRDETLHRARTLWTNLEYEECIKLLAEGLRQFPGDTEFSKLLESARQDQADQHRQSLLAEARSLLSAQRFDEAVRTLDRLLERFPSDLTAKNLRAHAIQGRDQQIRDQQLTEAKARLRTWVKQAKFEEVLKQAAQLSREFPDDFELTELLDFARTELSQLQQKRRLEQCSRQIQQALKDNRSSEAILAAEKALLEFPKNLDLMILLDRAKKEQSEKEKHEVLKQRLREVERLMDRQQLTDAIDLARQTLATVGKDSRIEDTLLKAEKELEFREKKKRQQNDAVQQARTFVEAGKLADATSILDVAIHTQLLRSDDPRVTQLLNEIDSRKEPPSAAAAAAGAAAIPSPTLLGSPISTRPASDPGKDYVYQRGTPLPQELVSPERDAVASAFSPTIITGPSTQPAPPPAPVVPPQVPEKTKEKRRRPEDLPYSTKARGIEQTVSAAQRTIADRPAPAGLSPVPPSPAELFQAEVAEIPQPQPLPIPRPLWKNPIVLGVLSLALAGIAVFVVRLLIPKPPQPLPPEEARLWDQAQENMSSSPHHLSEALSVYQIIVDKNMSLKSKAQAEILKINDLQKQEDDWMRKGADAQSRGKSGYDEAINDYENARKVNGDREKEAEDKIEEVKLLIAAKSPAEIVQQEFDRAEGWAKQKQWERAKNIYQQVLKNADAPPGLLKNAKKGFDSASNHLQEENLLQRAQGLRANNPSGAKQLAQQVVNMKLDHAAEAQRLIGEIDAGVAAETRATVEERTFLDLRQQLQVAISAHNADEMKGLIPKFEAIAAGGGKHAHEAELIARNDIPISLKEIESNRARDARDKDEAEKWRQTKADCDSALNTRDMSSLASVKNRLDPFLRGTYGGEAKSCLDRVNAVLNSPPPKPQPPVDPTVADKAEIQQLFAELSKAFEDRNADKLIDLWPQIPASTLAQYRTAFEDKNIKSVNKRFDVNNFGMAGDSAQPSGIWTGVGYRDGKQVLDAQGKWRGRLVKTNGHWRLSSLELTAK